MNSHNLSVHLLGKFKIIESVVAEDSGPFITLTKCGSKEGQGTLETTSPQKSRRPRVTSKERSITGFGKTGSLCAICCKCCNEENSKTFEYSPETLEIFLKSVAPISSSDLFVSQFQRLPFCFNCFSAIKYLGVTLKQIQELEWKVSLMKSKFRNVVKLSSDFTASRDRQPTKGSVDFHLKWNKFRETILEGRKDGSIQKPCQDTDIHGVLSQEPVNDWDGDDGLPILSPAVSENGAACNSSGKQEINDRVAIKVERNVSEDLDTEMDAGLEPFESGNTVEEARNSELNQTAVPESMSLGEKMAMASSSIKLKRTPSKKLKSKNATGKTGNVKGHKNARSFNNLPPEKLSQTKGAILWRKLRAEHPELSQRELKELRKKVSAERRKIRIPKEYVKGLDHAFSSGRQQELNDRVKVKVERNVSEDLDTERDAGSDLFESGNTEEEANNSELNQTAVPESMSLGEKVAMPSSSIKVKGTSSMKLKSQNNTGKNGNLKGLNNPRSFNNLPPEKLSQTPEAIQWRKLRAEHPDLSQRELKELRKKLSAERRNTPKQYVKGLEHAFSFIHRDPATLSQSKSAILYRRTRLQYPDKSGKEIDEIIRQRAALQRQLYGYRKNPNCETTEDGRTLFRNVEIIKTENGLLSCGSCADDKRKEFSKLVYIQNHINRAHGPRDFKCSKCGKTYHIHHIYRNHIRYCQSRDRLVCHLCGATFNEASARYAHMRIVHEGIKPHTCEHCGHAFGRLKDLRIHVRRHTGERPFVCHVCGDGFVEKQSMKKHIRTKHPEAEEDFQSTSNNVPDQDSSNPPPETVQSTFNFVKTGEPDH